jgi:hypothetical protein
MCEPVRSVNTNRSFVIGDEEEHSENDSAFQLGDLIADRFLVERLLGEEGSVGAGYLAVDRELEERVVCKVAHEPDDFHWKHFREQYRKLTNIRSPDVVGQRGLYSHGDDPRLPVIVLEWIDGLTLKQWAGAEERSADEKLKALAPVEFNDSVAAEDLRRTLRTYVSMFIADPGAKETLLSSVKNVRFMPIAVTSGRPTDERDRAGGLGQGDPAGREGLPPSRGAPVELLRAALAAAVAASAGERGARGARGARAGHAS